MYLSLAGRRALRCCRWFGLEQSIPCSGCHTQTQNHSQPSPLIQNRAFSCPVREHRPIRGPKTFCSLSDSKNSALFQILCKNRNAQCQRYKCSHPDKVEITDSEIPTEEWIHPDNREESELSGDSELKDLLRELATDFGMKGDDSDQMESTGEQETVDDPVVNFDGGVIVKKQGDEQPEKIATTRKERKSLAPVFRLDDITELLHEENALDVCVIRVPPEKAYVDYFIVVTARSSRHLIAMTQSINKIYKARKNKKHPFVLIEGKNTDDWHCIDFGNIVVHFMLDEVRELYELEKLWLLGPEYDDQYQRLQKYQESLRQALMESGPELVEEGEITENENDIDLK